MSVCAFKMLSGEDIVASLIGEDDTTLIVKDPALIVMQRTETGIGVGLQPYTPFAEGNKVCFNKSAISATFEVNIQMQNEYNRIFGNGIVIASASELKR